MNLRIRCDYKKHKIKVTSDAQHICTILMIMKVFTGPKKNRYLFLVAIGFMLAAMPSTVQSSVDYLHYLPTIATFVVMLAICICKHGPPRYLRRTYFVNICC